MRQSEAAGSKVQKHTTIEYTLSTGSAQLTVPNIVGQPQADAEAALRDMGLETSVQQDYSADVAIGSVISVSPDVGTSVNVGDTVTLVVSKGASDVEVTVPSVRGISEEDAKATLENLGLIVTVETGTSSSVGEGEVYEQSISSGTRVNSGTEITISVNRADATNNTPPQNDSPDGSDSQAGTYSGTWACSKRLGEPSNYSGGAVKLELVQNVNGETVTTPIVEGATISLPV